MGEGNSEDELEARGARSRAARRDLAASHDGYSVQVRPWSFVILGCGVHLGDEAATSLCPIAPIALPSLHLIGRWDLLCRTGSERLAEQYTAPTVYTHDWGHSLPAGLMEDAECAATVRTFIVAQQQALAASGNTAHDGVSIDPGAAAVQRPSS